MKKYTIYHNGYLEGTSYGKYHTSKITTTDREEAKMLIKANCLYSFDSVRVTVEEDGEIIQDIVYTGFQLGLK